MNTQRHLRYFITSGVWLLLARYVRFGRQQEAEECLVELSLRGRIVVAADLVDLHDEDLVNVLRWLRPIDRWDADTVRAIDRELCRRQCGGVAWQTEGF